jgi:class 3 adenylate cyclase
LTNISQISESEGSSCKSKTFAIKRKQSVLMEDFDLQTYKAKTESTKFLSWGQYMMIKASHVDTFIQWDKSSNLDELNGEYFNSGIHPSDLNYCIPSVRANQKNSKEKLPTSVQQYVVEADSDQSRLADSSNSLSQRICKSIHQGWPAFYSASCSPQRGMDPWAEIPPKKKKKKPTVQVSNSQCFNGNEQSNHWQQSQLLVGPTVPGGRMIGGDMWRGDSPDVDGPMSITGSSRSASMRSLRLRAHAASGVTVLCIDIKGFTAGCAEMSAGQVGEWVAEFYQRVDQAASARGVRKVEVRGDCCVCVAGAGGRIPWFEQGPARAAGADGEESQVTRMLAFAADLHADLATLAHAGAGGTCVRMGVAAGDVSVLLGEAAAGNGGGGGGFVSVQGEAATIATRMEALSTAGTVLVHSSAVKRWAAEGGAELPWPASVCVGGENDGAVESAVFDCALRAFRLTDA